jgi:hypothetical protein
LLKSDETTAGNDEANVCLLLVVLWKRLETFHGIQRKSQIWLEKQWIRACFGVWPGLDTVIRDWLVPGSSSETLFPFFETVTNNEKWRSQKLCYGWMDSSFRKRNVNSQIECNPYSV